ncbi:MAG TPA: glucose-6-phosphate dehydrogenase [Rhodocyclaceae bacterium]|nr:glucose-6-phosphate dehydrogenase [Rhodocyclaceae bacterium]
MEAEDCLFVMFGATGDLMRRKLLPALYQLAEDGRLPMHYCILGVARETDFDDARFRDWVRSALSDMGFGGHDAQRAQRWCETCLHYQPVTNHDGDYQHLRSRIAALEHSHHLPGNRILYMALPPEAFSGTIAALEHAGLAHSLGWTRLVIEKPFGHDLASAQQLNQLVHRHFDEHQVYRIDHYLGKETVQNLLAFRFGNALFESAWNREHIKSVQITVAEALGVERRAPYYERTGALRDMVQNHLTQLLTLTAMEVPAAFDAESIRFEKIKVLRSVQPVPENAVVLGQYVQQAPQGEAATSAQNPPPLRAYRDEPGVDPQSQIETFAALRLSIDNWRWQGVPFLLRTGKRLARRSTRIAIEFRGPPVAMFHHDEQHKPRTNVLTINLQPDEGFNLSFEVKQPGEGYTLQTRQMEFRYADAFGKPLAAGYETLLLDVIEGDQTLFVHADETEAAWRLYTPLLHPGIPREPYPAGSWGPTAADRLLEPDASWVNS